MPETKRYVGHTGAPIPACRDEINPCFGEAAVIQS
ncbi:hypothetical protein SAVIM338S_03174 [Streptomyces avidinii]